MIITHPKITVIVAVLNGVHTLERCLASITSQEQIDRELIVIDGGSTDGSLAIIKKYLESTSYWESGSDQGIYHAWNKAISHAGGDWICFLGADDYFWERDVLKKLIPHLQHAHNSGIRIVYGQAAKVDNQGNIVKLAGKPWKKMRWQMKHGMPLELPHPGLMHHSTLFKRHGMFDESFQIAGDYEFLLRELRHGHQALYAKGLRTVGCQVGGIADSYRLSAHREIARARKKNGLCTPSWIWLAVYVRAFFREYWRQTAPKKPVDKSADS